MVVCLPVVFRDLLAVGRVPLEVGHQAGVGDVGLAGEEEVTPDGPLGVGPSRQDVQPTGLPPVSTLDKP